MRKLQAYLISLFILILAGCVPSSQVEPSVPLTGYELFVRQIQSENLEERGIDIIPLVEGHIIASITDVNDEHYVIALDTDMVWCNLSKNNDSHGEDLVVRVDVKHNEREYDKTLLCVFVTDANGQYRNVLLEDCEIIEYELINILGNARSQIKLITKISDFESSTETLRIMAYTEGRRKMSVIFNEMIRSDNFFTYRNPDRTAGEKDKYRILCDNEYQFIPAASGGYDIMLNTSIGKRENTSGPHGEGSLLPDMVLAKGSTRFIYNGTQYVPAGVCYEYRTRAQSLCDSL